jgi:hypothetical protein
MMTFEECAIADARAWEQACPDPDVRNFIDEALQRLDARFGLDLAPVAYDPEVSGTWDDEIEVDEGGSGPPLDTSSTKEFLHVSQETAT